WHEPGRARSKARMSVHAQDRLERRELLWQGKYMSEQQIIIDGPLARAARALCRVSAKAVASRARLDKSELKRFEKGLEDLTEQQETRLHEALQEFGAQIITDNTVAGYGGRMKSNSARGRAT